MSIAVYPRLAELLAAGQLTLEWLERRIEARFGLEVDTTNLLCLTETAPLQQADFELAGAAAALGVGLDDLVTGAALPGADEADAQVLEPTEGLRLAALLGQAPPLSSGEQYEQAVVQSQDAIVSWISARRASHRPIPAPQVFSGDAQLG